MASWHCINFVNADSGHESQGSQGHVAPLISLAFQSHKMRTGSTANTKVCILVARAANQRRKTRHWASVLNRFGGKLKCVTRSSVQRPGSRHALLQLRLTRGAWRSLQMGTRSFDVYRQHGTPICKESKPSAELRKKLNFTQLNKLSTAMHKESRHR